MKPILIIITEGHPFIDTGFIHPELNIISDRFSRIEVFPMKWQENPNEYSFPMNVSISPELSQYLSTLTPLRKKFHGLFSSLLWRNIFKVGPIHYKSLLNSCGYVSLLGDWILSKGFEINKTLFYTYWLTLPALSLCMLKEKTRISFIISRAHGYDLYNERGDKILNMFKPYIFQNIDKVYCISTNGREYLANHYPSFSDKFRLSRLGTENNRRLCDLRSKFAEVVSCSFIAPVKRIELLIDGLECFQKEHPDTVLRWTHIGGGAELGRIKTLCENKLRPGSFVLKGNMSVNEILDLYSSSYFNCFINVSKLEGLPVSIMEAQSAGIPVIATSTGGTPEIVNNENGLLLSSDPHPHEISNALYKVIKESEGWNEKRAATRKNWEKNFRAATNYNLFGDELLTLFE